jgi:hypothetical protein
MPHVRPWVPHRTLDPTWQMIGVIEIEVKTAYQTPANRPGWRHRTEIEHLSAEQKLNSHQRGPDRVRRGSKTPKTAPKGPNAVQLALR